MSGLNLYAYGQTIKFQIRQAPSRNYERLQTGLFPIQRCDDDSATVCLKVTMEAPKEINMDASSATTTVLSELECMNGIFARVSLSLVHLTLGSDWLT